jgi:hypothetical protein
MVQGTQDSDIPMFARSPSSDAFGKLIADIPPIRIDPETLMELHRMAAASGYPLSEFVREVLRVKVWGFDHVANVRNQRLERAFGNASGMKGDAS